MDFSQISYAGSPWSLVVHCTFFGVIQIQDDRQAAILDFESERLLELFLRKYWMDLSQISYAGSPWSLLCIVSFLVRAEFKMADRRPSWILKVKVCYRYFWESPGWIFLKFPNYYASSP